jgi:rod shape-determining protein MreC
MKYVAVSFLILLLGLVGFLFPLRDAVVSVVSPIQFGLQKMAVNLKQSFSFFTDSNKVRNENLTLLQKIQDLEQNLVSLKTVTDENLLLKQQLGLPTDSTSDQKLILATVMGNPVDLTENTVIINRGARDGVTNNDVVVVKNYLIGITRNVEYARSTVELITSPNLSLTAYDLDSPDKSAGLVKGEHGASLSFERILPNERVSVGDTVVTSGKDGIFLPNLILGKVTDIQNDPSQPLKKATIHTIIDISKLTEVFVIKK